MYAVKLVCLPQWDLEFFKILARLYAWLMMHSLTNNCNSTSRTSNLSTCRLSFILSEMGRSTATAYPPSNYNLTDRGILVISFPMVPMGWNSGITEWVRAIAPDDILHPAVRPSGCWDIVALIAAEIRCWLLTMEALFSKSPTNP